MIKNILLIAQKDFKYSLKEKTLLLWLFIMPLVFFGFIGSTTGGLAGNNNSEKSNIALWENNVDDSKNIEIIQQIIFRLNNENFNIVIFNSVNDAQERAYHFKDYTRRLWIPEHIETKIESNEQVIIEYETKASGLTQNRDQFSIEKALYQTLGDMLILNKIKQSQPKARFKDVNEIPRNIIAEIDTAGEKQTIPSGYNQAVPGILVMFIMMIALSNGSVSIFLERQSGLLKRLAATPITKKEIIIGKWLGKWFITVLQLGYGMIIGWLLFKIHWGQHIFAIILILLLWAAFNAALAVYLGSIAKSEGQVSTIATISSLLLAALGGCWWPIEITPAWMQNLAQYLPTGWVMDCLHKLMYFGAHIEDILLQVIALLFLTIIAMLTSFNKFRFS